LRQKHRKSQGTYDKALYQVRHLIEDFFRWVKQFRGIAMRYDKTARNFLAAFQMVAALCWLNRRQALAYPPRLFRP